MKRIKKFQGWSIYENFEKDEKEYKYSAYLPDQSPLTLDDPEWEADNLQEILDFINTY